MSSKKQKNSNLQRYSFEALRSLYKAPIPKIEEIRNYVDFVRKNFERKGRVYAGDGRSRQLWFIGIDCHGWGIDEDKAIELAYELNDKIFDVPESNYVVEHQIKSAYRYRKAPFGDLKDGISQGNEKEKVRLYNKYREIQRVREILSDYVYVIGAERFINMRTGFETTNNYQTGIQLLRAAGTDLSFATVVKYNAIKICDKLDFRPDIEDHIFEEKGLEIYNRYRKHVLKEASQKEIKKYSKIFSDHLRYLTNNEEEYRALLNYLAFICQNPGEKLSYALLVVSKYQGIGKSRLQELFKNIFGNYVGDVENRELTRGFTHFMHDKLLVFIHELAQSDRYNAMNHVKNLITEETVQIDAKYARPYTVKNTVNFIFFSNHFDAAFIDKYNRRLLIISNEKQPKNEQYYVTLSDAFENHAPEIYQFLKDVDLTEFNAKAPPIKTEGRALMVEQSKSEIDIYLGELLSARKGPFSRAYFSARALALQIEEGPQSIKFKAGIKAIQRFLIHEGFKSFDIYRTVNGHRTHQCVWSKANSRQEFDKLAKEEESVYAKKSEKGFGSFND